jgi:three-Cys-motif partner protein
LAIPVLAEPEPQEYLRGSARIALETDPPFHRYVFIDRDPNHCAELENLKVEFPTLAHKIDVITSDANEYLRTEAHGDWRLRRAVLFLDPYGMQVEWKTLEAIAGTRAVDVWYLFPLAAVNRLLPRSGNIPDAWRERLNRLFGDSGWEKVFYQKGTSIGLFGNEEFTEKTATFDAIRNYLLDRLKSVFSAVSEDPRVLSNSRGAPLFLLCFAVSNENGAKIALRIADHILSA